MTDSPTYPRYPSQDDVPTGPRSALPEGAPGSAPPPATPAPDRLVQPLGLLTRLTALGAISYTALMLPRPWLAMDAEDRWLDAAATGRSAYDMWTPYELVDLVGFAVMLGTFVVTCLWLWRVRTNVEALSPRSPQARKRGWIWAGWFVPVVGLWFPYQVVRDALRVRSHHPAAGSRVGWWWGAFLVVWTVSLIESNMVPWDEIDTSLVTALPYLASASTVLFVVACSLWIRVVRAIAADQHELLTGAR